MYRLRFALLTLLLFPLPSLAQEYINEENTPETFRYFDLHQPVTFYDVLVNRYTDSQTSLPSGFYRTGFTVYHNYLFREIPYPPLDTHRARTRVHAMLGSERDQMLFIEHHQKLGKGFTTGIHYQSLVSPGFLRNQLAKHKGFGMFIGMDKKRYDVKLAYRDAKVNATENGGIIDTLLTEVPERSDLEVIPVNLSSSTVIHRRQVLTLDQNFLLTDSVNPLLIFLDASFIREGRSYRETSPVSEFYPQIKDTIATYDTTYGNVLTISPAAAFYFINDSLRTLSLKAGYHTKIAQERISDRKRNLDWAEYFWTAKFEFAQQHALSVTSNQASGEFASGNYDFRGDYTFRSRWKYLSTIYGNLRMFRVEPSVTDQYYTSNHLSWNNGFDDESGTSYAVGTELIKEHLFFKASGITWKDKIVISESGLPQQLGDSRTESTLQLTGTVVANKVGFTAMALYRPSVITEYPLPETETYLRIAYRNRFFKEALSVETGASAFVTSPYNAGYYDPSTGKYRVQTSEKIGDVPVVNVFVNLRIRTCVISVMLENLTYGWFGRDLYYSGPRNPAPPRMLRFSINWLLTN